MELDDDQFHKLWKLLDEIANKKQSLNLLVFDN